jgi:hypothetical protein
MSAKTFEGAVSIVLNTKGEIALKRDPEGIFTAVNASECYLKMKHLAMSTKTGNGYPINKYSLYIPEGVAEGNAQAVLLANRYGNPYIAMLAKRAEGSKPVSKVIKLA